MIQKSIGAIVLVTVLLLVGCNSDKEVSTPQLDEKNEVETLEVTKETEASEAPDVEATTIVNDEYPLPILDGWEEIEIAFKTMGDGKIEMWTGEFSFEGPISDYFELYQDALTDAGFEVELVDDTEGFQKLKFTKNLEGKVFVGDTLFNQRWVKSGLQHFK